MEKIAGEDDRISELPDSIIHHIFSLMRHTKEVARTTLLSKNWKRVFDSYQSFDFDHRWFRKRGSEIDRNLLEEEEKFKEYVERSLETRLDRLDCVDKLRVHADNVDLQCVARWIRAAMAKNVKELHLNVCSWKETVLPIDLTQSSSITSLKIQGDPLCSLAALKMSNLRVISIKRTSYLDENVMKEIEQNCPLLEDLRLVCCSKLLHLKISSLVKLRRVEVQYCFRVQRIEVAAPNLETFWFHDGDYYMCVVDLECLENLRNLTLNDKHMTDSDVELFISKCPLLEKLELNNCNNIEKLRICSLTLKSLAVIKCSMLDQVDVDAPNLYSFRYEGRVMPFPLIKAPCLSQVDFSFKPYDRKSTFERQNFFWNFDGSKGFKLIVYTKQNMKIFEEPREADLYETAICKIELTASSSKVVKSVDNWLRDHHGKSLVVVSSNGELLKSINTLIMDTEDGPRCCKCWRNYIEDVKSFRLGHCR